MIVSLKGSDRRREVRVFTRNLLNLVHDHELHTGRTVDLSPQGAQIELSRPLAARDHIQVQLQLCLRDQVVPVTGRVVWVRRRTSGRWAHGIEFEAASPAVSRHLARA